MDVNFNGDTKSNTQNAFLSCLLKYSSQCGCGFQRRLITFLYHKNVDRALGKVIAIHLYYLRENI